MGLDPHSLPNAGPSKDAGEKSSGHLPSSLYASTLPIAVAFLKNQQGLCSELVTGLSLITAASWHLYFFVKHPSLACKAAAAPPGGVSADSPEVAGA